MSLSRQVRGGISVLMAADVVESTGKCKLETHRFGTSDCRKVCRSERVHERLSFCVLRNAIRNEREERGVSAANGNRIRALPARCVRTVRNRTTTTRQHNRIGTEAWWVLRDIRVCKLETSTTFDFFLFNYRALAFALECRTKEYKGI